MLLHFSTEQWLPYSVDLVFAFFANPENLPRLMPPWQKARIEEATFAPPPPRPVGTRRYPGVVAGDGTRLTISFRPLPLLPARVPWEALIENFSWNQGFCDVQQSGPFVSWRHCHTIQPAPSPDDPGLQGSLLTDAIEYELPLGPLSSLADKLIIHRQLTKAFAYRHKRATELLAILDRLPPLAAPRTA